jgi:hypothetical protein
LRPKREEAIGDGKKLHGELHCSRLMEHAARVGENISVYRVLVRKSEGKRPKTRPRCRLEDINRS